MMRPYPRRNNLSPEESIYNYRLSCARRIIKNSFGILASRFRIFRRPIIASVENVKTFTRATIALHNFLMSISATKSNSNYFPHDLVDQEINHEQIPGSWRRETANYGGFVLFACQGSNNYS